MKNTKLSVVIITFNEEKNIGRCLASVQEIADEIVVVDSFSTDKTKEICESYGVRFFEHPFEGHIQQKNYAAQKANYKYVLSLDADEALSGKLKEQIKQIKSNFSADGYYVNRLSNYCNHWIRHCGWYPDKKLRIWNKEKGEWGGKNPHDKFMMYQKDALTKRLKGDLLHYTFHTISQHVATMNNFSSIEATSRFERGKRTNLLKIIFKPFFKFFIMYVLKLGFLDGYYGYIVCKNSAHAAFLREIKIRELSLSE